MCDRESFAKIRDAIGELQKADAVQSEQIKTLFHVTERQGDTQTRLVNRLVLAVIGVLILAVLALIFGALGERDLAAERAREYADAYADATNRLAVSLADYMSASNRAARAEARHNAIVSWAEEQRDKVISPLTKAIWQAFIDRLKKEDD